MTDPQVPEGSNQPVTAPTHGFGSAGWDTSAQDTELIGSVPRTTASAVGGSDTGSTSVGSGDVGSSSSSTKDAAKEQTKQLAGETAEGAKNVAQVAQSEAASVVSEATNQARNLFGEAKSQLSTQAADQKGSLVTWLKSFADEIDSMVSGEKSPDTENGTAATLARRASGYAHDTASWLDDKEPSQILNEVGRFARRRPGVFLAIAAAAGVVAGRLTRGLTASQDDDDDYSGRHLSAGNGYQTGGFDTGGYAPDAYTTEAYTTAAPTGAVYEESELLYADDTDTTPSSTGLTGAPGEPGYVERDYR